MKLHEIRYFLALSEKLNFIRAAHRCGVSQPSLSDGIKRLERIFARTLFIREERRVQLMELGRRVNRVGNDDDPKLIDAIQ
jgi:DNA-binding transcriptional LysR family regulator